MNAYDAADKNNKVEELHRELVELATAKNFEGGNGGTRIPATLCGWRLGSESTGVMTCFF